MQLLKGIVTVTVRVAITFQNCLQFCILTFGECFKVVQVLLHVKLCHVLTAYEEMGD